jgi:SAM-dependent methyltransferase/ribosomal protein S18 acetylase RimI-like enzyme
MVECGHYLSGLTGPAKVSAEAVLPILSEGARAVEGRGVTALVRETAARDSLFGRASLEILTLSWADATSRPSPAAITALVADIRAQSEAEFLAVRLSAAALDQVSAFEDAGFRLVDQLVVLDPHPPGATLDPSRLPPPPDGITLGTARETDIRAVAPLAEVGLRHGRFLADPHFSVADQTNWRRAVGDGLAGRAIAAGVAIGAWKDGRLVGIALGEEDPLASRAAGTPRGYLGVILVAPEARGLGLGDHLYHRFMDGARARWSWTEVSTQTGNGPALDLYGRWGARAVGGVLTLHAHGRVSGRRGETSGPGGRVPAMVYRDRSLKEVEREYSDTAASPEDHMAAKWGSEEGMVNRFRLAAAQLDWPRTESWLDVGCGTGRFQREMLAWGLLPRRCVGLDLVPELVERARKALPPGPGADRIAYLPGSLDNPAILPDPVFSVVTMIGVLQQCGAPPDRALSAALSRLAPGGVLFLTSKNLGWEAFGPGGLEPEHNHSWFDPEHVAALVTALGARVEGLGGFEPRSGELLPLHRSHTFFLRARRCGP